MSIEPSPDINQQIDRILSSNIHSQLLNGIPLELLQSPVIVKTSRKCELDSASSFPFENRSEIEDDLYEKAEQIFRLKEVLECELANINQIVMDNQKLTKANGVLRTELRKITDKWKKFNQLIVEELKYKSQEIKFFQNEQIKIFEEIKQRIQKRPILEIQSKSISFVIEPLNKIFVQKSSQTEFDSKIKESQETIENEIEKMNFMIAALREENSSYKNQIKEFKTKMLDPSKNQLQPLQQKQLNRQQIDCYSSIFMNSMFEDQQKIEQIIRKFLFNPQKPIFTQLEQVKYFGKIILRTKNGNAIEQYKNGFQYEGKFLKNQRHGIGKLFNKDKLIYAGEWRNGKFEGKGILYYYLNLNVQKIQANFRNGMIDGFGMVYFSEGHQVRALFRNNVMESEGMIFLGENINSLSTEKKSYISKINFLKDQENMPGIEKLRFETLKDQFIEI